MEDYTLADAQALNTIKNRLRDITRMLDALKKVYPDTIEASQVKHETLILLTELQVHGLLPADVNISSDPMPVQEEHSLLPEKKGVCYVTVTIVSLGKALQMPTERVEGSFEDAEKWVREHYDPDEVVEAIIEELNWLNK